MTQTVDHGFLARYIRRLEVLRLAPVGVAISFFAVVTVRNLLEIFSDSGNQWTSPSALAFLVHFPLFYACVFLTLVLIVRVLTRTPIEEIVRVMFRFLPMILLAPVIDLLVSGGHGRNMSYLFDAPASLARRLVTLDWGHASGATLGIKIEVCSILALLGAYVTLKSGRIVRGIAALVLCYVAVFAYGALPSLVAAAVGRGTSSQSVAQLFAGEVILHHFYTFNHKMVLLLFPIFLAQIAGWLLLRRSHDLLKLLRPTRLLHYLCMLGLGMLLGSAASRAAPPAGPFGPIVLVAAALSVILAFMSAIAVNDRFDRGADRVNRTVRAVPSPLTAGRWWQAGGACLLLSVALAVTVRHHYLVSVAAATALSWLYSAPPFRAKRVPILSTLLLATCAAVVCLGGYSVLTDTGGFGGFPLNVLAALLVSLTLGLNVKDVRDAAGDRMTGVVTLPGLLGERKGRIVTGCLAMAAYLSVSVLLGPRWLLLPGAAAGGATFALLLGQKLKEAPIFMVYFAFIACVGVSLFVGV